MGESSSSNSNDPPSSSAEPCETFRGFRGFRGSDRDCVSYGPGYALNVKVILCSLIIMLLVIIVVLGLHTYAWWLQHCCCRRRRSSSRSSSRHQDIAAPQGGLDAAVLKSLPTFTFNGAGKDQGNLGDCPVCLSEFEDGEAVRVLPKCGHAFHAECIDMWFQTHSNCPICRAPVQAQSDADAASEDPAAISSPGHGDENENSSSNDSPVELLSITVETPPSMEERFKGWPEEQGSGSDGGSNRAKSPCKPGLSMKRIWSV